MKPFVETQYEYPEQEVQDAVIQEMAKSYPDLTGDQLREEYKRICESGQYFVNDEFLVVMRPFFSALDMDENGQPAGEELVELAHLSVSRHDKAGISWEQLQSIKTELLGADCECVELYPAEERNFVFRGQRQLFAMPPGQRWPVGFETDCGMDRVLPERPSMQVLPKAEAEEVVKKAMAEPPAPPKKSNAQFKADFERGKEEYMLGNYKIPFPAHAAERLQAYILGQKAGALELLYQRHERHNAELMAVIGMEHHDDA